MPRISTLFLLVTLGLGACADEPAPTPAPGGAGPGAGPLDAPPVPAVDPVPAELPPIVARVNGLELTRDELERAIRAAETQAGQPVPLQLRDQVYRRVLDRLIDFHLLLQEAYTRDIAVDDTEVEAEVARVRDSYPSVEAFEQQLLDWNSSLEVLREETRKDLLVTKTVEQEIVPDVAMEDEAIRAFYDQHPDQFATNEAVEARHILIGTAPNADAATRETARDAAATVRSEAVAGADFAELARTHSTDEGTAPSGGTLGLVERGQTVPPFEEALFALQAGEISEIVESPFGYHIIQAGTRREAGLMPFEQAQIQIRNLLVAQERQLLMAAFITRLRESGAVEILI